MELDEYEYLERAVENLSAETKNERRSTGGDNRSSRRSMSEERSGGERVDRERSSSRRDKDQRDQSIRDGDRVHRSREMDDDRDRDRLRRSREKDLDQDRRSRERNYDDRHHRRSRDRDHRSRDYEEDLERERRRRRSSSRLHEREVESGRPRSRDTRSRDRELESMERERRRFKERKESVEPEADPERDQRTVFAYQMPLKATERDVYEFFSQAGKVRDVRLIMDRISRRSKGVGYIEFYDAMSVPHAIALSTRLLLGQPVLVKPSEAEKNLVQSNSTMASGVGAASDRKIYVGNLHYNITEPLLRQIFEVFGPLELVQLPLDPATGYCKGYGFIQFQQLEHAKAARSLNGTLDIAGRIIKVSAVTDHVGGQSTGTNVADFDDEDGGGLALNARSRAILMQKLDRTGTATSIVESLGIPVLNGAAANQHTASLPMPINAMPVVPPVSNAQYLPPLEPIGDPSECLLLKNMFDPSLQVDPDLYMDVKEDVEDECSKFGSMKHILVDKKSGFVYLRFDSVASASDCQRAMNKRWYGGKVISATFMRPHEYDVRVASDT